MATKTLGFKKDKPEIVTFKRLNVQSYEEEFLNFWKSLGFRKEQNKNSKSYASSVKSLRKVLEGDFVWAERVTLSNLRHFCEVFRVYADSNTAHISSEGVKCRNLKNLYFHEFVMTYSGYSYLRDVIQGKIKSDILPDEIKDFVFDLEKVISKHIGRGSFSSGERKRIVKFAETISTFYEENRNKIAFGVDKISIVKAAYRVINDFVKAKGITPNILIYTGNYASGAALTQAMDLNSYWKIYDKHEDDRTCVSKDPEKVRRIMEERKRKEEEDLPDIVKRRREEMKKNGIAPKTQNTEEDCSRRDEYLRKKQERRNPFGRK